MSKNIMLIEDDKKMQELIQEYLENFGFNLSVFGEPKEALDELFSKQSFYDLVVLDLMLPNMDGFDVCKIIKNTVDIPIIISSARGDIGNKIYGYELGADDYLAKPYNPRELVLKVETLLKRYKKSNSFKINNLTIDEINRTVKIKDYKVDLTKAEFDILLFLIKHTNSICSREQIATAIGLPIDTKKRVIDMHISNIRYKIGDDAKNPEFIKSIWGMGYKFVS
ncbi:response regulator transcription factor [Sulfurimonas sediminis]|uniref:Response regulator transcription factor n=1 Tax=Sulfurimonas sediminis TaxID=2590020 RepID=A0A7M1B2W6_9BACT|nr:response regulator transcription factor [Sulfurimonas sediminis]QOP43995.1 response regulator transcription factor [Sulfurimonas sediminis]